MKNLFLTGLAVLLLSACKDGKSSENTDGNLIEPTPVDSTAMGTSSATEEAVYVCPMHPEVVGSQGDKCSKCQMDLVPMDPSTPGE